MIIYVKNNKGGTGKSSISRNLAHGFTTKGFRTALVSGDSQNDSLILLGKEFTDKKGLKYFSQYGEDIKIRIRKDLDYYPLETNSIGIGLRKKLLKAFERLNKEYDIVIIDGAPSKEDQLSKIAAEVTHQIIIPVQLDGASIKAIKRLQETVNIEKVSCVVPNLFLGTKDETDIYNALDRFFESTSVYLTKAIKHTTFERRLCLKGKSIYDSRSKKTLGSKAVYDEIMDVIITWE